MQFEMSHLEQAWNVELRLSMNWPVADTPTEQQGDRTGAPAHWLQGRADRRRIVSDGAIAELPAT